jgi:hypothetical protein
VLVARALLVMVVIIIIGIAEDIMETDMDMDTIALVKRLH